MKKLVSILAALALLLSAAGTFAESIGLGTMYVYTQNGKSLNVRSEPYTGDNIIGHVAFGDAVDVVHFEGDWAEIAFGAAGHPTAWVQSRFLQWYAPTSKPTPKPDEDSEAKKMQAELASEVEIEPLAVQAHATRASGWVNMRKSPSKETKRIQTCADGSSLTAFAETTNWYRVTDPATGNSGYIRKDFLTIVPVATPAVDEVTRIGTVNVNGEFLLQGKIPEGYKLQVISSQGSRVIATLTADDGRRPMMMLSVAFDDLYSGVERMNDLSAEDLEILKNTYTQMNEMAFSEAETAAGTKLLIARESGSDTDFVSILSVYQGYFIEFVLSPNPDAAEQILTDDNLKTAIDFLSNLNFIPAN